MKAKSEEIKAKLSFDLDTTLPGFIEARKNRDFREKDNMLKKLYRLMREVYAGVRLPCKDVQDIALAIVEIMHVCGNTAKLQARPPRKL